MIKVLGIEHLLKKRKDLETGKITTYHGGVDYVRLVQPINELGKLEGFKTDVIWEYPLELDNLSWWDKTIKKYDVIVFTYIDNPIFYSALKILCNKNGVKCVIDLDDNIWGVDRSHPFYEQYRLEYDPFGRPKFSEGLYNRTVILADCDHLIVTNQFLKYKAREFTKKPFEKIEILPNYIDLSLYDYKKLLPKTSPEFVIAYAGGASHWQDLHNPAFVETMNAIFKKYPNVVFRTTAFYPELKARWGKKYQFRLQRSNFQSWVDYVWTDIVGDSDIVIAPLLFTSYSRAKTGIKFLEYSAGKRVGVYQNIDPYQELVKDGENGFLAGNTEDWIKKLSLLIENEDLRKKMGENAYKTAQEWQMKDNVGKYADFFTRLLKKA